MLSSYRATPHPSTGIAPGSIMFRSRYKKDFPCVKVDDIDVQVALQSDRESRQQKGNVINASNHRMQSRVLPNQLVYIRNNQRTKFDPIFGPAGMEQPFSAYLMGSLYDVISTTSRMQPKSSNKLRKRVRYGWTVMLQLTLPSDCPNSLNPYLQIPCKSSSQRPWRTCCWSWKTTKESTTSGAFPK